MELQPLPGTKPTNPKDAIGSDKVPYHVMPLRVMSKVALAFLGGALKYGSHNYRKAGVRASIYIDGALRHIIRFAEGEDDDPDVIGFDRGVRIHHLDEAIAGLTVLRDSMLRGNWTDDRAPFSAEWMTADNAMAKLIISCNPNSVMPVTEASLRETPPAPTPSQPAGADTPAPVEPAHPASRKASDIFEVHVRGGAVPLVGTDFLHEDPEPRVEP